MKATTNVWATALGLVVLLLSGCAEKRTSLYAEMLRMEKQSESLGPVRKERARKIAEKVYEKHKNLQDLSLNTRLVFRECKRGTPESLLPEEEWALQMNVFTASVQMTPDSLHMAAKDRDGAPLVEYFLHDGVYREYKWPRLGAPGEKTRNPRTVRAMFNRKKLLAEERISDAQYELLSNYQCRRGVDEYMFCELAVFYSPWPGPFSSHLRFWRRSMSEGTWIGQQTLNGVVYDVILNRWSEEYGRSDVFYVDGEGLLHIRNSIAELAEDESERDIDRAFRTRYYTGYSTAPIPADRFAPSRALQAEAKNWVDPLTAARACKEAGKEVTKQEDDR